MYIYIYLLASRIPAPITKSACLEVALRAGRARLRSHPGGELNQRMGEMRKRRSQQRHYTIVRRPTVPKFAALFQVC